MARSRDIRTNQSDLACDICGRTLLRGEHAETFLAGGSRREVCDLCTARAQHEGWIRESGADELELRHTRHDGRGRSFLDRFRARRERATPPTVRVWSDALKISTARCIFKSAFVGTARTWRGRRGASGTGRGCTSGSSG